MRHDLIRAGKSLIAPTLGLVFVLAALPGRAELAIRVYALLLSAVALLLILAALRRAYRPTKPLRPAAARPGAGRRDVPGTLERLEQEVALGVAGSFDLHHRLRPRIRGLASERLAVRRGISLDQDPERARRALGDGTWDLVRHDRPPPTDRLARGIPISELTHVVESLEGL